MVYKKIIILGGSCSGKSTLADRIGKYTDYKVYHLDAFFTDSDWKRKDENEINRIYKEILSNETGIIEGGYIEIIPERIKWADLIIFIYVKKIFNFYIIL